MKKISKVYNWVVRNIPLSILHILSVLILTVIDNGLAIGAALGRESIRLGQLDDKAIRVDTIKDLAADAIGFGLGTIIKTLL